MNGHPPYDENPLGVCSCSYFCGDVVVGYGFNQFSFSILVCLLHWHPSPSWTFNGFAVK